MKTPHHVHHRRVHSPPNPASSHSASTFHQLGKIRPHEVPCHNIAFNPPPAPNSSPHSVHLFSIRHPKQPFPHATTTHPLFSLLSALQAHSSREIASTSKFKPPFQFQLNTASSCKHTRKNLTKQRREGRYVRIPQQCSSQQGCRGDGLGA